MIHKIEVPLSQDQQDMLKPLMELVNSAWGDVENGDKRGMLFAQVRPEYGTMNVFFLPNEQAKRMIDTFDSINEELDNPPREGTYAGGMRLGRTFKQGEKEE
jgi:hypothetical protein